MTAIDGEEDEDTLLVTTIKNQTKDKKASRDQNIEYETDPYDTIRPVSPRDKVKIKKSITDRMRNTTQGFNFERSRSREAKDPMRESTMYFLKQTFTKDNQRDSNTIFGNDRAS